MNHRAVGSSVQPSPDLFVGRRVRYTTGGMHTVTDGRIGFTASDGVRGSLRVQSAADPKSLLVFHTGLGIKAGYYTPFARGLAERGHTVAVLEPRGVGNSSVRAGRDCDFGFTELIELDIAAALDSLRERFAAVPWFMGGHSLGAQLSVLAGSRLPEQVKGLVLVAGGSPYIRGYSGSMVLQTAAAGLLFPIAAMALGWFPGKALRFGGREAKTFMLEWSRCLRTGRYRSQDGRRDFDAQAAEQQRPTLAVTIDGDAWAPAAAMANLVAKMPRSTVDTQHLTMDLPDEGNPHFTWARSPQAVVATVEPWLDRMLASQ